MNNRLLALALAGLGMAAAALVAGQAPASAGPGDPKKKDLAETGCRDVVDGTARYYRDRIVDIADLPDKDYPDEFQGDAGTATLDLVLSAPSCAHVTYTLTVHALNGDVLGKTSVPGDGSGTPAQPLVLTTRVTDYPQDCLKALIATTSVQGIVVDTAPDAIPADSPVCDGGSPSLSYR